jgi:hypothetical protein
MKGRLPNFLIIGAMKSGTTSLYHYLQQHPQVYMSPVKEPAYFAAVGREEKYRPPGVMARRRRERIVTDLDAYRELFAGVTDEIAIGEASVGYLHSPWAAKKIHELIPDVKLLAILRNPVERAYSHFKARLRDRVEHHKDFRAALAAEADRQQRKGGFWNYTRKGFYSLSLQRYYDQFDADQIRVFRYEDFQKHPLAVMRKIFAFLGVNDEFRPDIGERFNTASGVPRSMLLHHLSYKLVRIGGDKGRKRRKRPLVRAGRRLGRWIERVNLVNPPMDPSVGAELTELFREDIQKTAELTGLDLSAWLATD